MKKITLVILLFIFVSNHCHAQDPNWIVTYMANDSNPDNFWTRKVIESPDRHIFVGEDEGLQEYDGSSWSYHLFPNSQMTGYQNIWDVCFGIHHDVWVATNGALNVRDSNGIWTEIDSLDLPSGWITRHALASDTLGNIWVAAINGNHWGLLKFDGSTWTLFDSTNSPIIDSPWGLKSTPGGVLWMSDYSKMYRYDGNTWTTYNNINADFDYDNPNYIDVDDYGNVYAIGDSVGSRYIFQFDGSNWNKITKIIETPTNGLPPGIQDLKVDHNGNIWLACGPLPSSFLVKANTSGMQYFTPPFGIESPECLYASPNGTIWVGLYGQGLNNNYKIELFNEAGFNSLRGNIFYDQNQDGTYQANEVVIPDQPVIVLPQNLHTMSNMGGYEINVPDTSGSYTVNFTVPPYWQLTSASSSYNVTQAFQNEITDSLDFGIYPSVTINDVSVFMQFSTIRPGFHSYGWIAVRNKGTVVVSDTITLTLDNNLTYTSSSLPPVSQSGNVIKWAYANLAPFEKRNFMIEVDAINTLIPGDTLLSMVDAGPVNNDTLPADNYFTCQNMVMGSYDPNSKEVSPKGQGIGGNILPGQRLTYTINFQNTGNDTAFCVILKDTLPLNADLTTLTIDGNSHPFTSELVNQELTFRFDRILLPDSNINEPASHGFVSYSLKPKAGLPDGSILQNKAYIIFDFNTAVITNEVTNTIDYSVGIQDQFENGTIKLFPNPFSNQVMIISAKPGIKFFYLYDVIAGLVLNIEFNGQTLIDLSRLSKGAYLYQVRDSDGQIGSGKLIKQ